MGVGVSWVLDRSGMVLGLEGWDWSWSGVELG